MRGGIITSHVALALLCVAGTVFAQAAPPPLPKIWTVTASAGLAMTSGNSDTVSTNAAYDITYDPPQRNIVKSDGSFFAPGPRAISPQTASASMFAISTASHRACTSLARISI